MSARKKTTTSTRPPARGGQHALRRVARRRSLDQWSEDEPLTIAEAVALDVTAGALSEKGIRTAIENRALPARKLNGRFYITIRGVRAAFAPSLVPEMPDLRRTANDNVPAVRLPTLDEQVLQQIGNLVGPAKR
jgi:hypothetical protein